jgi:hypothetical protein
VPVIVSGSDLLQPQRHAATAQSMKVEANPETSAMINSDGDELLKRMRRKTNNHILNHLFGMSSICCGIFLRCFPLDVRRSARTSNLAPGRRNIQQYDTVDRRQRVPLRGHRCARSAVPPVSALQRNAIGDAKKRTGGDGVHAPQLNPAAVQALRGGRDCRRTDTP